MHTGGQINTPAACRLIQILVSEHVSLCSCCDIPSTVMGVGWSRFWCHYCKELPTLELTMKRRWYPGRRPEAFDVGSHSTPNTTDTSSTSHGSGHRLMLPHQCARPSSETDPFLNYYIKEERTRALTCYVTDPEAWPLPPPREQKVKGHRQTMWAVCLPVWINSVYLWLSAPPSLSATLYGVVCMVHAKGCCLGETTCWALWKDQNTVSIDGTVTERKRATV